MAKNFDFGLKIPFCCCFNLRTAGLVTGYINLILYAFEFLLSFEITGGLKFAALSFLAFLFCVGGCWVYGIHTESIGFMIPGLIVQMVFYALFLILLVVIPMLGFVNGEKFYELVPKHQQALLALFGVSGAWLIYIFFIFWSLLTALQWLITAIKYSLFKQMKANQSNAAPIAIEQVAQFTA